jgi:hypothetical protein
MSDWGWIGVDLDGTLAEYHGWVGATIIGKPIEPMVTRVKKWLAEGKQVRIFTARVFPGGRVNNAELEAVVASIEAWCRTHLGQVLEITYSKDFGMIELWDDRAVQVIPNTGLRADGKEA